MIVFWLLCLSKNMEKHTIIKHTNMLYFCQQILVISYCLSIVFFIFLYLFILPDSLLESKHKYYLQILFAKKRFI
jgi:hypothetical protein